MISALAAFLLHNSSLPRPTTHGRLASQLLKKQVATPLSSECKPAMASDSATKSGRTLSSLNQSSKSSPLKRSSVWKRLNQFSRFRLRKRSSTLSCLFSKKRSKSLMKFRASQLCQLLTTKSSPARNSTISCLATKSVRLLSMSPKFSRT